MRRFDSDPRLQSSEVLRSAQDFACGLPASHTLGLTPAKPLKFDSDPRLQPRSSGSHLQLYQTQRKSRWRSFKRQRPVCPRLCLETKS